VLLAIFIDREALKCQIPPGAKIGSHVARPENRALDGSGLDAILDEIKLDGDGSCYLNGATEADFAVALAEMEIAD
jgi:hypothetical protein